MSKIDVVMPQLGESLTEGTIIKWHKKPGEKVKKDETLLEISTDKVDSEIPAPASGVVTKILFPEQKTVEVRTVIAEIETDEDSAVVVLGPAPAAAKQPAKGPAPPPPAPVAAQRPVSAPAPGRFYSPLVLTIAREEGIPMAELEQIPGTGEGGRVSKKDLQSYLEQRKQGAPAAPARSAPPSQPAQPAQPAGRAAPRIESTLKHVDSGELAAKYPPPKYEILQMSNVLLKMSEHMMKSVQTSPHVWGVHECDMTRVDTARRRNAESFERREGFKLTFMPFICDAIVKALKQFPLVNSSIEGDKIILKKMINLGIAVATENGLIVPVIKDADEKNFTGLGRAINDLGTRARTKKLTPAEIEGGTFTITNYGVFGTVIGVPIINQPQVAILGTGSIEKRAVVINDGIAVRSIGYFTLGFDHRIVDGALGGSFLETVVKLLENFDDNQVV
ncbi:MAG TPA: dihydrolipoamide acetyltransferase family protein [Bacteroidota bacterium]|nr:dihydrolipoamide acetyltransferase family protein [Bacteroidota bacterium]